MPLSERRLAPRLSCWLALVLLGLSGAAHAAARPVRVLIINMFQPEAAPWLAALAPTTEVRVPGLSADYPVVHCTADDVCQMTTGMGHANAAASTMAVLYSGLFDLRQTYFVIAGIAGIDPARATIGSAAWARYVVDGGIAHEIDAREIPRGWPDGYFGVLTESPDRVPEFAYRTEMFRLDESLLRAAQKLSASAPLEDSAELAAYRSHYREPAARAAPTVVVCDTLSSDTWWAGKRLGEHARHWTRLLTRGEGVYCTTQQEDNATLNALTRGARSGLVDLARVAVLRSGSDFDRPYPGQAALASLHTQLGLEDAGRVAVDNLVIAGLPLVHAIAGHWSQWQSGVPANPTP